MAKNLKVVKATDFVLFTMGQGRMIPGFEEGIVGHKSRWQQFDIDVTFPSGIPRRKLER